MKPMTEQVIIIPKTVNGEYVLDSYMKGIKQELAVMFGGYSITNMLGGG